MFSPCLQNFGHSQDATCLGPTLQEAHQWLQGSSTTLFLLVLRLVLWPRLSCQSSPSTLEYIEPVMLERSLEKIESGCIDKGQSS